MTVSDTDASYCDEPGWILPPHLAAGLSPTRIWAVEEAWRITRRVLAGEPVKVWLFGSYAQGTVGRYSDIDIAVEATGPLNRNRLSELIDALEDSNIPYYVDVVEVPASDTEYRAELEKTGVPWPID
ncbi:MAG: nucleotidyltransferase domain-containing protein [Rhodospirillaceae bacterium]|nr:nucleotidyltransferase domain-containing protein [Rhodospirillaceae bacterium]